MRYIRFFGGTPYCGEDYEIYEEFTDKEFSSLNITKYSEQLAEDNAEEFAPLLYEYDNEEDFEEEECYYWENVWSNWEEVTKEEYEEAVGEK